MRKNRDHDPDGLHSLVDVAREIANKKSRLTQIQEQLDEALIRQLAERRTPKNIERNGVGMDQEQSDMRTLRQHAHCLQDDLDTIAGCIQSLNELRTEIRQLVRVADGDRPRNVAGPNAAATAQRRETVDVKTVL